MGKVTRRIHQMLLKNKKWEQTEKVLQAYLYEDLTHRTASDVIVMFSLQDAVKPWYKVIREAFTYNTVTRCWERNHKTEKVLQEKFGKFRWKTLKLLNASLKK